ncbi:MmgE/PrpD family protein [Antarctobacter sp.]|uniref:MmgE/PrpD family protein n=1 Tax=Antarctobacter sp. TaxID=1872577 RepID=UPI003A956F82
MTQTLTDKITAFATATTYASLPDEVREQAKKLIFDEIACSAFGRRSLAGTLADSYVQTVASAPQAQVWGSSTRASAGFAAMANGAAGHGEEVDGAHGAGGHPGSSIVHAAMATAEMLRATGADLINAVVLGYDVGVRLRWACGGSFGARRDKHLHADFLYALGCAVAASRLMGQDATRMGHALALTTLQANGLYATYSEERHISKSFCEGQYAYAGVAAAQMSAVGLEGNADIIGAHAGLLDAWGIDGGREMVEHRLGEDFEIMGAGFKFFNAGYPIHAPLEGVLGLVEEHKIDPAQIAAVTIEMNDNARHIVDGRAMHNICIQDMVAANLARGGLRLSDRPFPEMLEDPVFRALRPHISVESNPEFKDTDSSRLGARVSIVTKDGRTVAKHVKHPRGYESFGRVTWEDLERKWAGELEGCDLDGALRLAKTLDTLEDISQLSSRFATARS